MATAAFISLQGTSSEQYSHVMTVFDAVAVVIEHELSALSLPFQSLISLLQAYGLSDSKRTLNNHPPIPPSVQISSTAEPA